MSEEQRQTLSDLIETYLESNPSVPREDKTTSELEVKFGTLGVRALTRIDYDNVVNELYNHGFTPLNAGGKTFLRIQNEYLDPRSGRTKLSNVRCEIVSVEPYKNTARRIPSRRSLILFSLLNRKWMFRKQRESITDRLITKTSILGRH